MALASPTNPAASPRPSGPVVPAQASRSGRLAAAIVWALVRTLDASLRCELAGSAGMARATAGPVIFAIWHDRLALSLMIYRRYFARAWPGRRMAAIVSASRDGGLLARVLELSNVQPVRGSSSRRGAQAVLEMASWAARGYDLAITPDGPRGPRHTVQNGAVALAQVTGLPIVPVFLELSHKWRLRSWDRFQVPMPFARCRVFVGEALDVPREITGTQREELRQTLESRLRASSADT
jgi:lysophospholipid acyltransferase (LPLAT)-like uncharacterized protein